MYTIIDIETTGNGIRGNKITEISIIKFDGENVIDEFTSLVNPQCAIPYFITGLTGIDDQMVQSAPTFDEIARKVLEITEGCIFVAHSVNFDYGVIKEEFRKIGIDFTRKKLCTVRLSRRLIPGLKSYSLGKLCSSVGIKITDRHRAYGDAKATTILFKKLLSKNNAATIISNFLNARSQEATLPPLLQKSVVDGLPQRPGVYYFKNEKGTIIYVGKAINIKKRVLGHFYDKSTKEIRMCREIAAIDFELSGSELLALLMESMAIKKHFPLYNRAQKRISKTYAIFTYQDREGFIHLAYGPSNKITEPIKIFHSQNQCREFLRTLCDSFELCEKYCHLRQIACDTLISKCSGACQKLEASAIYNKKVSDAIHEVSKYNASYLVKEKGRSQGEDALISIINGAYQGYAFIGKDVEINSLADIEAFLVRQKNTIETESIISGYLLRKTEPSILELNGDTMFTDTDYSANSSMTLF